MAGDISASDYIRWVKGSLNRLMGTSLPDDATTTPEYRMWIMAFQTNQKLTVNAQVDVATQNALIKCSQYQDDYVRWIQNALVISGEGIGTGGKNLAVDGRWGPQTQDVVKDFQINHEKGLKVDGVVGAKTETTLMKRTGTVPPGRPGGKKLDPKPGPWDSLLTAKERTETLAFMYRDELEAGKGSFDSRRREQMQCFLNHLSKSSFLDQSYRYMDVADVTRFVETQLKLLLPPGVDGKPDTRAKFRLVADYHAKKNAKKEAIAKLEGWIKGMATASAYAEFKKYVDKLYVEILQALNSIQYKYSTDPRYAQDVRIAILHDWATELTNEEEELHHMFTCFKNLHA